MKTIKINLFLLALLATLSSNINAQSLITGITPKGTLKGTVELAGQITQNGVYVFVEGTSFVGVSDASGAYSITGVPFGTYTLKAQKDGYTVAKQTGVVLSSPGEVVSVPNITLTEIVSSVSADDLFIAANRQSTNGEDMAAIASYQTIMDSFPNSSLAIESEYKIAFEYYTIDSFAISKARFKSFLAEYPTHDYAALTFYWRGKISATHQDYVSAIAMYDSLISEFPDHYKASDALYSKARACEKLNDTALAIATYRSLITNYPTAVRASDGQYNIGSIYSSEGNYDQAINEFNKVISNYPGTKNAEDAEYQIAYNNYKSGNFSTAETRFIAFINDYPNSLSKSKAMYNKASSYYNNNELAKAITEFDAFITTYPNDNNVPAATYYKTNCKYDLESYSYKDARVDYAKIITTYPNSGYADRAQYKIGWCYYI